LEPWFGKRRVYPIAKEQKLKRGRLSLMIFLPQNIPMRQ
jgi:hypothetical protein